MSIAAPGIRMATQGAYGLEWLLQRQAGSHRIGIPAVFTAVLAMSTCVQVWAFFRAKERSVTGMRIEGGKITSGNPLSLFSS